MLTSLRDAANSDEADAVNILINALTREDPDKGVQSCDTDKLRKGLGRVSFESSKVIIPNFDHLQSKSIRTSIVIPNAPINKDHQTLLGKSCFARIIPPLRLYTSFQRSEIHFRPSL